MSLGPNVLLLLRLLLLPSLSCSSFSSPPNSSSPPPGVPHPSCRSRRQSRKRIRSRRRKFKEKRGKVLTFFNPVPTRPPTAITASVFVASFFPYVVINNRVRRIRRGRCCRKERGREEYTFFVPIPRSLPEPFVAVDDNNLWLLHLCLCGDQREEEESEEEDARKKGRRKEIRTFF